MQKEFIFVPALLMVLLTMLVWLWQMIVWGRAKVEMADLKTRKGRPDLPLQVNAALDNFLNIFEVPVLLYALVAFLYISNQVSNFFIVAGFIYVALRYLHSLIMLSYNNVQHRFFVWFLSCAVLWAVWISYAVKLSAQLA